MKRALKIATARQQRSTRKLLIIRSFHHDTSPQPPRHYLLAHMNYARLKAPMEDPSMSEFRLAMDPVNALAKATPGYVWSLDDVPQDQRDAVPILRDDDLLMPQLSLWENLDSIQHFAFRTGHAMYLKRKREWFTPPPIPGSPIAVCWWWKRPATTAASICTSTDDDDDDDDGNHIILNPPTLQEAFERLSWLETRGPTEDAFDFKSANQFPMPLPVSTTNANRNDYSGAEAEILLV